MRETKITTAHIPAKLIAGDRQTYSPLDSDHRTTPAAGSRGRWRRLVTSHGMPGVHTPTMRTAVLNNGPWCLKAHQRSNLPTT